MKQSVKRITITGADWNTVSFDNEAPVFLVKNFGANAIEVSFDNTALTTETIKINEGYFQEIEASGFSNKILQVGAKTIYIKGTADDEVEVQQICLD